MKRYELEAKQSLHASPMHALQLDDSDGIYAAVCGPDIRWPDLHGIMEANMHDNGDRHSAGSTLAQEPTRIGKRRRKHDDRIAARHSRAKDPQL